MKNNICILAAIAALSASAVPMATENYVDVATNDAYVAATNAIRATVTREYVEALGISGGSNETSAASWPTCPQTRTSRCTRTAPNRRRQRSWR